MFEIFKGGESKQEIRRDFLQKLDQHVLSLDIDLSNENRKKEEIRKRKEDTKVINEGGDFEVQVHIQELRDLVGVDWGETNDPVVTVTILDQKKSTKKVDDKTNITLNQILFFSLKALEPRQLLYTKCAVEVFDHNLVFPNKLIGSFEFNLGSIYYKKHHELYNQWVALSNNQAQEQNNYDTDDTDRKSEDEKYENDVSEDRVRSDGIQGSLKLTISILGANDEQHIHTEEEDEANNAGDVLLPPSITQTPWKLTIRIYAYKHLARLDEDAFGFIDRIRHDFDYYSDQQKKLNLNSHQLSSMIRALVPDEITNEKEKEKKKSRRLDPFFIVQFGDIRINTHDYKKIKPCKGCENDKVFIQFELPVMEPTYCEYIHLEIHDEDLTDSDLVGVIRMNYRQLKEQQVKPRWYHIHGSPVGYDADQRAVKMNKALVDGTYFRGQCLIEVGLKKEQRKVPVKCFRLKPSKKNKAKKEEETPELNYELCCDIYRGTLDDHENYELCCDIYRGTEMYNLSEQMYIEIAIGNRRAHIDRKQMQRVTYRQQKNNDDDDERETWNIHKKVQLIMEDIPRHMGWQQDMLQRYIFVYLCVGKKEDADEKRQRVAYHRISMKDIFVNKPNEPPKWYDMKEDLVLDEYEDGKFPGSLLMAFHCKKNKSGSKPKEITDLPKDTIKRTEKMFLRGDIYFGKNMASTDLLSQCDAYLQMRFCGKTARTKPSEDRTDPEWFQTLQIDDVEVPYPLEYAPAIYCEIFDKNNIRDKAVGRFEQKAIEVSLEHNDDKHKAYEYTLKSSEDNTNVDGTVLARFELSTNKAKMSKEPIQRPSTVPHSVHIIVLGLRDLSSVLGVHDCHIVFELGGKKYKSRKSNAPDPRNPNFCEIMHFDVELPVNDSFLPNFNISVKDSLFGGLIERTIGYASKSVAVLRKTEVQRIKFLSRHEKTLREAYKDTQVKQINNGKATSLYDEKEDEKWTIDMEEDGEEEIEQQTKQLIELSTKSEEKKPDDIDYKKFVYFNEKKKMPEIKEKKPKWMRTEHGERKIHDDELEDVLQKHEGDFPLNPFLDIPLYSIGKNRRNIGTFKGLVSFAPKRTKLLVVEVYDCKDLKLYCEKHDHPHPLNPFVVVTFDKTELTSSWKRVQRKFENDFEIKQTFEIPIIEPLFVDNDDIRITIWNKREHKKDKDHIVGYVTYKYSQITGEETNGWVQLKHNQFSKVGQVYTGIKVVNTKKLQKARVVRIAEPQYTNMQKSKSYQQEKELKLQDAASADLEILQLDYRIGMQYIREITRPKQLYLRLYVLNGINMTPPDGCKLNDPYLSIAIGEEVQTTKSTDMYKKDILQYSAFSPDFYESFEFLIEMPGPSSLKIECWDNTIFGIKDSLIGSTTIDVENRWYDPYWRTYLKAKPIETRTLKLHHMPHGKLRLWLEILTVEQKKADPHMIDISQPEKDPYELRLIIWKCKDVPVHDDESMNDLFCKAYFDNDRNDEHSQETDVHFRSEAPWEWNPCHRGPLKTDGSFNWRMKFPIHCLKRCPAKAICVQVYDKDYFSANDLIGEARIPLKKFLKYCRVKELKNRCIYKKNGKQKMEYEIEKRGARKGTVVVTLELVPYKLIKKFPAGIGRAAPNNNPHLPDPTGRKVLSMFRPCRSIRMLLGKRLCLKVTCLSVVGTVIYCLISFFPQLFTEIMVENLFDFKE